MYGAHESTAAAATLALTGITLTTTSGLLIAIAAVAVGGAFLALARRIRHRNGARP